MHTLNHQKVLKCTIHINQWHLQGITSCLKIFKAMVHFETSDDELQGMVPCARSDGQTMVAEAHAMPRAHNNYILKPLYFTKNSSNKVDHPNMMAYSLGAHTR